MAAKIDELKEALTTAEGQGEMYHSEVSRVYAERDAALAELEAGNRALSEELQTEREQHASALKKKELEMVDVRDSLEAMEKEVARSHEETEALREELEKALAEHQTYVSSSDTEHKDVLEQLRAEHEAILTEKEQQIETVRAPSATPIWRPRYSLLLSACRRDPWSP